MATKVHMEALSPTMEEGQLVRWLKSEGDSVASGDILAEIETDKAVMELVARGEGRLLRVMLAEGGTAEVGAVIGVIGSDGEDVSAIAGPAGGDSANSGATSDGAEGATNAEGAAAPGNVADTGSAAATRSRPAPAEVEAEADLVGTGRVKASPVARRMARNLGIELAGVTGSGPGGRVVKRDVEAARESAVVAATRATAPVLPQVTAAEGPEFTDLAVSQLRKTIARRLGESVGPVPTFFLTVTVDATRLLAARKSLNTMLQGGGLKVSVNDFVLKAAAVSLHRHPECNSHWMGESIRRHNRVHLGVAVAVEDGLITPVVRDANLKGIAHIGAEVRELAGRAREKRLMPEEYTGSTFSVSNLGMFGIHEFTAIINPPEAGILAIGGIEDTVVVEDGEIVVEPRMRVTMSCDHRVIDGAQGARFLATLKAMLEEPAGMAL